MIALKIKSEKGKWNKAILKTVKAHIGSEKPVAAETIKTIKEKLQQCEMAIKEANAEYQVAQEKFLEAQLKYERVKKERLFSVPENAKENEITPTLKERYEDHKKRLKL